MGKVIGTVLKIGGIAALGLLTAGAGFLLAAGAGVGFVSATFGTAFLIAGAAVNIGGSLAAGAAVAPELEDPGLRLNLTTDPAKPREICYGQAATGGNLVFRDTVGTDNSDLWMVTVLAGHEIESIEDVKFGGITTTFSSNNAVGNLNNFWFQFEHLGTDAQTVDTDLDTASTKWTTNHRLRGAAYIVNRLIYDQDKFSKGLEQIVYTIKGKKLYDPRLDTTQGGSGTHRFADKSTWAWSENPVLCMIDYLRGEIQNTRLIWGMGQEETAFDWPNMISEANICEEQITLKAGGTEDRYTCNGFLNTSNKHETNIRAILSSCAGNIVWQSSKWRMYVGAARTAVKTRVESQFIGPVKYVPKKEYRARTNAIRGLYNDPEAGYQAKDYPPVIDSTFVTEDGGQELWGDLNLPMTKSKSTAQRLANIALRSSRMEKTFSGTLNTIGFEDQAQDSVNLTYSRFNLSSQKMIISDWALRFQPDTEGKIGLVVEETFIETDDNIYAWTAATDEATIPAVIDLLNPDPVLLAWEDVDTRPVELTDGRISAGLDPDGDLNRILHDGILADQGNGIGRRLMIGFETDAARDGDAFTFATPYSDVPIVEWFPSGITTSTALSGDVSVSFDALDVTTTGFNASILLKELAATIVDHTDTVGEVPGTGGDPDRVMEKQNTTPNAAWDDKYTFQFDVRIQNTQITFAPDPIVYSAGSATFGIYIKTTSGGSFVKFGSMVIVGAGGANATTTVNNQIKTVTVTGVVDFSGVQFGVNLESSSPAGSVTLNLDSVKYSTATPPSESVASPTGASASRFMVIQ